jgi:hypothetical protein
MIKILCDFPNCNEVFDSGYEVGLHKEENHKLHRHIHRFNERNDVS